MTKYLAAAVASAAIALSAAPASSQTAAPAPMPARDADYHNRQHAFLYGLSAADGWSSTASGLRYRRTGGTATGPRPSATDTVTIHYVGRFIDGTQFDSSVARGEPATFPLPRLILGWQEGVPLMQVGETYEFAIPAPLAYGYAGRNTIPGGATLLFTIELLAVPSAAAQAN